jgi:hypothetical protein
VGPGFSPLDEELALVPGQLTPLMRESLARLGTWMPFGRAVQELAHFMAVDVGVSTARRATEAAGAAYEALQTAEVEVLEREMPPPPAGPAVQQLSVDGALVPLVGGVWAEVKTLAIGTVQVREPRTRRDREQTVHTTDLSYFSRLADHETFGRLATVETHRRGTEMAGVVCAVVDGAEWEQGFIDLHRPDAVRILDWGHGMEYVAKAGAAVYGAETAAGRAWLDAQRQELKHGAAQTVLRTLGTLRDELATRAAGVEPDLTLLPEPAATGDGEAAAVPGAGEAALQIVTDSLAYLEKRHAQIQYAAFQAQGYPIGDGAVESANKLLVEARLKGAGMHWAREHVNPLVALRTLVYSDRWAEAWPAITTWQRQHARQCATVRRQARGAAANTAEPDSPLADPAAPPPPPASPAVVPPVPAAQTAHLDTPHSRHRTPYKPPPDHPWRRQSFGRNRCA